MTTPLLEIEDVVAEYRTGKRAVRALDGASLTVHRGETVGIVGESGSGKSTLGLLVGRLLPKATVFPRGRVLLDGESVLDMPPDRLARLRRDRLAFVPQDPVGALDPTLRIGRQLRLACRPPRRTPPRSSTASASTTPNASCASTRERSPAAWPNASSSPWPWPANRTC